MRSGSRRPYRRRARVAGLVGLGALVAATALPAAAPAEVPSSHTTVGLPTASPAMEIAQDVDDDALRDLLLEVLERNPSVSSLDARSRAAEQKAPQAGSLPDPMLSGTAFVKRPETRVGPQVANASLSQRLPWFGKRALGREAATWAAEALDAEAQARRLELVTETRRSYYDLAFLDALRSIIENDRATLSHFEELARTRYTAGVGMEQGLIKIHAEITKADNRLLDVASRRAALVAQINALRDLPQDAPIPNPSLPSPRPASDEELAFALLRERALAARPEVRGANAAVRRGDILVELARKGFKPDLGLAVTWTAVGDRGDPAGQMAPPPDNGRDSVGIGLSLNLPVYRGRLEATVGEAAADRLGARARQRAVIAEIDRAIAELVERVRITKEQVALFENVLVLQAEQALRSTEAGYSAGALNSLDLLDAERTLLDVRTGAARARADHAIVLARLEGAMGAPLREPAQGATTSSPGGARPMTYVHTEGAER